MAESQLVIPFGLAIDEPIESESLNEALQLSFGDRALQEVYEVRANAAFGKEALRLSRLGALLHSKDLHFHSNIGSSVRD